MESQTIKSNYYHMADCLVVFYSPLPNSITNKPYYEKNRDVNLNLTMDESGNVIGVGLVHFKNRTMDSVTSSVVYEDIPADLLEKLEYWFGHKEEIMSQPA